jgi:serine/threonine protein kinase
MFHIGVSTKHPPLPEPGQLSEIGIDFIELCLTLEAARRPTASELLRHPWLMPMQEQLTEHNSTAQSSFGSSFQSTHMTSMRSHGFTPETGMTPDTEMTAFTMGHEKSSRTNSEEAAHVQKYETAQGTAIDPTEVSHVLIGLIVYALTRDIVVYMAEPAE